MRPELVSALVAHLAHEGCDVNGELYAAGGGHAARIFIAETAGYDAPDLTPEDVRDHWEQIRDAERFFVPTSMVDYTPRRQELLARIAAEAG
jgi:hypothetical protein